MRPRGRLRETSGKRRGFGCLVERGLKKKKRHYTRARKQLETFSEIGEIGGRGRFVVGSLAERVTSAGAGVDKGKKEITTSSEGFPFFAEGERSRAFSRSNALRARIRRTELLREPEEPKIVSGGRSTERECKRPAFLDRGRGTLLSKKRRERVRSAGGKRREENLPRRTGGRLPSRERKEGAFIAPQPGRRTVCADRGIEKSDLADRSSS